MTEVTCEKGEGQPVFIALGTRGEQALRLLKKIDTGIVSISVDKQGSDKLLDYSCFVGISDAVLEPASSLAPVVLPQAFADNIAGHSRCIVLTSIGGATCSRLLPAVVDYLDKESMEYEVYATLPVSIESERNKATAATLCQLLEGNSKVCFVGAVESPWFTFWEMCQNQRWYVVGRCLGQQNANSFTLNIDDSMLAVYLYDSLFRRMYRCRSIDGNIEAFKSLMRTFDEYRYVAHFARDLYDAQHAELVARRFRQEMTSISNNLIKLMCDIRCDYHGILSVRTLDELVEIEHLIAQGTFAGLECAVRWLKKIERKELRLKS